MNEVIYYGVGKNLRDNLERFLEETGKPVCLCDRDTSKQHTMFCDEKIERGLEILGLEEVLKSYPDGRIYLTLAEHNLMECYSYLIEHGVNRNQICFFGKREFRLGCRMMQNFCYVQSTDANQGLKMRATRAAARRPKI